MDRPSQAEFSDTFSSGKFFTVHKAKGISRKQYDSSADVYDLRSSSGCWIRVLDRDFDLCFDAFVKPSASPIMIISAQDALLKGRTDLPYFYRSKWSYCFRNASFITFNDPSLYDQRGGLVAGYFQKPGAITLATKVIARILMQLKIKKVLVYGASAGGFWALVFREIVRTGIYVIDVPQIDLSFQRELDNTILLEYLCEHLWRRPMFLTPNKCPEILEARKVWHDIVGNGIERDWRSRILYLQNNRDTHHVKFHLPSFLSLFSNELMRDSYSGLTESITIEIYENEEGGRGHSPLSPQKTQELLGSLIDLLLDNNRHYWY